MPDLASYRYRAVVPSQECKYLGFNTSINEGEPDIVVFSKPTDKDLVLADGARKKGLKIVVDICDDHFDHPVIGKTYRDMVRLANSVVCPTYEMAVRIKEHTGINSHVIGDAYETELSEPHAKGNKLFWFGHISNLKDVEPWLPFTKSWDFSIATGPTKPKQEWVKDEWIKWGPKAVSEELQKNNVVILPTSKGSEYKSPNRLLNTIRSGCFPICANHPSYVGFEQMIWVGDIRTGLLWAREFQDDLNNRILEAQSYIEERFSRQTIGKQWAELLNSL